MKKSTFSGKQCS